MEDLPNVISRVCRELTAIQERLSGAAECQTEPPTVGLEAIWLLRDALDNMRQVLWTYMDGLPRPDTDITFQTSRMQRATELLREIHDEVDGKMRESRSQTPTFFKELQHLATEVVDKHLNGGREAPRSARADDGNRHSLAVPASASK